MFFASGSKRNMAWGKFSHCRKSCYLDKSRKSLYIQASKKVCVFTILKKTQFIRYRRLLLYAEVICDIFIYYRYYLSLSNWWGHFCNFVHLSNDIFMYMILVLDIIVLNTIITRYFNEKTLGYTVSYLLTFLAWNFTHKLSCWFPWNLNFSCHFKYILLCW